MTVELTYWVTFGSGDSSDNLEWEVELTPEEEIAYNNAVKNETPLNEVEELQDALRRAYKEIQQVEICNSLDMEDEYAMECQGQIEMDCDELNDLVEHRDSHAIDFFNLTDATEEELDEWDAYDLDEIPLVKDFMENFEPISPFDEGWNLVVRFVEPDEDY